MKSLTIIHPQQTNLLAVIGESLGAAGVNIEGLSFSNQHDQLTIHCLVADADKAVAVLRQLGLNQLTVQDVFILDKDKHQVTGKPGSFGEICRYLTEHGITLHAGYPAENNRYVFVLDDLAKATAVMA